MSDLLLRGGNVVTPDGIRHLDLRLHGGLIAQIGPGLSQEDAETVLPRSG